MFARLHSSPVHYPWGVVNAFSDFLGTHRTNQPEAELWFGAHPASTTVVTEESGQIPLGEWLSHYGEGFPVLVKLLAIARPLSIQVHPNSDVAREGFEQQVTAGSSDVVFADPFAKPELLIALSDRVRVMWGLLPPEVFVSRIDSLVDLGFDAGCASEWKDLYSPSPRVFVERILRDPQWAGDATSQLVDWAGQHSKTAGEDDWHPASTVRVLHAEHPGDRGILLALAMHWVTLHRGDGIYVHPGDLHCYLEGFGLEVMSPSDNVARAGLTTKKIDIDLFLDWATLEPALDPPVITGTTEYSGFPAPFRARNVSTSSVIGLSSTSLFFCESGDFSLDIDGMTTPLWKGDVVLCAIPTAGAHVTGSGSLWIVDYEAN